MVVLCEIPIVGDAISRLSKATNDYIILNLRYLFCYNNLVTVLNSEIGNLTIQEASMSEKADAEEADGKTIKADVLAWQKNVIDIKDRAKEFSEKYKNRLSWRCIQCLPIPNPVSRFQLGRKAVQTAKTVTEFTNSGKDFLISGIADLRPFENLPITDTEFQNFESRNDAYRKLWDQLETEGSFPILGIYGMPGVGKTRMMEQIWKEAIEKKIIKKVIRADVGNEDLSDKQVIIKLQQNIAGYLDCHFTLEDIVEDRASQLKDSLKNSLKDGGKILVIFDDVWSEITLKKIGITFDDASISKGCKILFISRKEDVCKKNKCEHPVEIITLKPDEAWNLFRNTVGTSTIDSLQDQSLAMARRVCNKGANLPPLIHAVGKALKFNSHNSLEGALYQLANGDIRYIQGIDPKVYAYLPAVENLPKNDTAFQNFESRKDVYKKLWEALVTEGNSLILGIYGMPGVGKTRMMEQIRNDAMEKGIFAKVTQAAVGNKDFNANQVIIDLQNQIARNLDCKFELQDDVDQRASRLKSTLMDGSKILIIFDDVWSQIPLKKIGITSDDGSISKGCKILFTSRQKKVCLQNGCKHPVEITTLEADEAWDLFRNTVGTHHTDDMHDEPLAVKVCNKCGGLPLVIHAVGKVLIEFMYHNSWEDALLELNSYGTERIDEIDPQVYDCLKWSFDRLVNEDAKTCLLLCSLFPEDADIAITVLFQLAKGSQLVHRSSLSQMVNILKSASLLREGKNDESVKLHDIIRDLARSIAVNDPKYAFFFVKCDSQLLDNDDYSTRKLLHLDLKRNDVHFPDYTKCPDLRTLWLQCNDNIQQFSGGFFSMFGNLIFLYLQSMIFSSQQQFSLQPLGKLRTIILHGCYMTGIGETDDSFFPELLETLCIWDCDLPTPLHLPKPKYLRKLEILRPLHKVIMAPEAISSLSNLEELHIPNGFSICNDNSSAHILDEILKLTRLTSLQITLSNMERFQDTNTFRDLHEFNIQVGLRDRRAYRHYHVYRASRVSLTRLIALYDYKFEDTVSLVERAEDLTLVGSNVEMSSICNSNRKAFADLRNLCILYCGTMEHLARISQDKIEHSRQPWSSFSKLITLQISWCSKLKYLFCNSVAKCLVQLENLSIENCSSLEVIIMNEGIGDGDIITFSKLKTLKLDGLRRLISFYGEKKDIHSSSTSILDNSGIPSVQFQPLFDGKVAFPSLEELNIENLNGTSDIWGNHYHNDNLSFCQLKSLDIFGCDKLEIVFQLSMMDRLRNLEYLKIWSCDSLRNVFLRSTARDLMHLKKMIVGCCDTVTEIIGAGEEEGTSDGDIINFSKLKSMELLRLPKLTSFYGGEKIDMHSRSTSIMDNSDSIRPLFDGKVAFPSLEKLYISNLDYTSDIWGNQYHNDNNVSFCQMKSLRILYCNKLEIVFQLGMLHRLRNLEYLDIYGCNSLRNVFLPSTARDLMHLEEMRVERCKMMSQIIGEGEQEISDGDIINFSKLKILKLEVLPRLTSFYREMDNSDISSLQFQPLFDGKVAFPSLENLVIIDLQDTSDIWGNHYHNDDLSFCQMKSLEISSCNKLEIVFQLGMLHRLRNLDDLHIKDCNSLRNVFLPSTARDLMHLKKIRVEGCKMMSQIIGAGEQEISDGIVFPDP